jgi:hypothetical protein
LPWNKHPPSPQLPLSPGATLRDDIHDPFAVLDNAELTAHELPHREKYLMLTIEFLRRLFALHLDWIDKIERELAPKRRSEARPVQRA